MVVTVIMVVVMVVDAAHRLSTDRGFLHLFAVLPLFLERVDVEFNVMRRRMPRRKVFGLD